jgi:hypothetical protein
MAEMKSTLTLINRRLARLEQGHSSASLLVGGGGGGDSSGYHVAVSESGARMSLPSAQEMMISLKRPTIGVNRQEQSPDGQDEDAGEEDKVGRTMA